MREKSFIPYLFVVFVCCFTVIIAFFMYLSFASFTGEVEQISVKSVNFKDVYAKSLQIKHKNDDAVVVRVLNNKIYVSSHKYSIESIAGALVRVVSDKDFYDLMFKKEKGMFSADIPAAAKGKWEVNFILSASDSKEFVINRVIFI